MRFARVKATGHDGMLLQTNASFVAFLNLRCVMGTRRSGDIDSK
jgi:hypothetical protein